MQTNPKLCAYSLVFTIATISNVEVKKYEIRRVRQLHPIVKEMASTIGCYVPRYLYFVVKDKTFASFSGGDNKFV